MWSFKPRPTRSSARPPIRPTSRLPVHLSARPPDSPSARPLVRAMEAPTAQSARPCVLGPVCASWAPFAPLLLVRMSAPRGPRLPVRSIVRTLSAPVRPIVRTLSAPSARPLIRPTASSAPVRPSAHPLGARIVHHVRRPVRHVRSARVKQPPLYIPHPASPQIIQLLAVRVGPRVFVAPLRIAALSRAQGLREVEVNCGGNPCNFFFAQQAAWRGKAFTSRETRL